MHHSLQIILKQNSQRGNGLNKFCPPKEQRRPLPSLLSLSFFYGVNTRILWAERPIFFLTVQVRQGNLKSGGIPQSCNSAGGALKKSAIPLEACQNSVVHDSCSSLSQQQKKTLSGIILCIREVIAKCHPQFSVF